MTLARLEPIIDLMRNAQAMSELGPGYLAVYPTLLRLAEIEGSDADRFLWLAIATYGWMPTIPALEVNRVATAAAALKAARADTGLLNVGERITPIASCVGSFVGASKILHFANPAVFPIWDSRVQLFWTEGRSAGKSEEHLAHYTSYVDDLARLAQLDETANFVERFQAAHSVRLTALGIPHYDVSRVRALECSAFELAGPYLPPKKTRKEMAAARLARAIRQAAKVSQGTRSGTKRVEPV